MKKNLAIYFALFSLVFVAVSCNLGDEDEYEFSPYALLTSFTLGNVKSAYPTFTSTGKDTAVVKTVSMANFRFTIDQVTGAVYNNDSLPYGTNTSKIVATFTVDGIASIYVDSLDSYEHFSQSDSLDFTSPRKVRVYAEDAKYYKDYTISINVHQVDPDMMEWSSYPAVEGIVPVRAVEVDGVMYLFGNDAAGASVVASTAVGAEPAWEVTSVAGLPTTVDFATVQLFGGKLYAVADGNVYSSENGSEWAVVASGTGAVAIVGASDEDGKLWIAGEQGVSFSEDGVNFTLSEVLPENFPLYGVSLAAYQLNHHSGITRYMLVGYTTEEKNGEPAVWSKLSTEDNWTNYANMDNQYSCPSLKGLAVVRYDKFLYAVGGAGTVNGNSVEAFSSFYISRDNGIAWKPSTGFYQRLPEELVGSNALFAVAVDSKNYMWIINSGESGGVWKGILNRLGFEKQ